MPQFEPKKNGKHNGKAGPPAKRIPIGEISEERCHVCMSEHRRAIDRMLAMGTSYAELERLFDISRRSMSRHDKRHLAYHDGAMRKIIAEEAEKLEENMEEGMSGFLRRRVLLEATLQKGMEALANNELTPEIKDLLGVIQQLDSYDMRDDAKRVELVERQFVAFRQAIQEILPPDDWNKILNRTKEILGDDSGPAALPPGS